MMKRERSGSNGLVAGAVRALRIAARWGQAPAEHPTAQGPSPDRGQATPADRSPRTLRDLGVPGTLAGDIEEGLERLGAVGDDGGTAWTFRTPDGVRHALRVERPSQRGRAPGRAA
ncbi:MAG TPA: hypothetical protein VF400_12140 [Anaeromyxobacteraceae bacterium]